MKWVEAENIHLTLLFLGEVNDRDINEVCGAVKTITDEKAPFSISVQSIGCFPNTQRPKVVWIGVGEGQEELTQLHDALEEPLLNLGHYRREARQYTPHITLGRAKGKRPADDLSEVVEKKSEWTAGEVNINEVVVFSSELTSKSPIYTPLYRAALRGSR